MTMDLVMLMAQVQRGVRCGAGIWGTTEEPKGIYTLVTKIQKRPCKKLNLREVTVPSHLTIAYAASGL